MKKWKTSTKILLVAGLILTLVLALLITWWIQSRTRNEMKDDTLQQVLQVEAIMSQAQKEQVALLALKYGIEEVMLQKLLDEYSSKHDFGYKLKQNLTGEQVNKPASECDLKVNLNFNETITNLSAQYNLPKDKIAALLVDYKIMSAVDKGNALETLLSSKAKQSIMKFSLKELLGGVKRLQ